MANQADVLKLKLLYEKKWKGPVSAVAAVEGYLLVCVGSKLTLHQLLNKRDLNAIAFYDAQMYITGLHVVKNYILVTDLYKSVCLLRWKEQTRTLALLSKDLDRLNVVSASYLVDGTQLTFVCADVRQNLHFYQYQPTNPLSRGGQKLVAVGNFHLGSQPHAFLRLKLNTILYQSSKTKDTAPIPSTSATSASLTSTSSPRYCLYYGMFVCILFPLLPFSSSPPSSSSSSSNISSFLCDTGCLDGSVGYLTPLTESDFCRLGRLEMRLVSELSHNAALNPKAYRLMKPLWPLTHNHLRRVLDGELLWQFVFLDRIKQYEIARQVGSTPEEIIDTLLVIDLSTHFF